MATREETKRMIEVMQAYADGEEVEWKLAGRPSGWDGDPCIMPSWNWDKYDYRVKPQPRVLYVIQDESGQFSSSWPTRRQAEAHVGRYESIVKFQEVLK